MAIGTTKVNGQAVAGSFIGYPLLVVKVACTAGFTVSTGGSGSAIVENGYDKAVKVAQTLGTILWLGTQNDDVFTFITESSIFNAGVGPTTNAAYGLLKDQITAVRDGSGSVTVTTSAALNGAGTFTFA
jgi:hypothetical protein